ncbi:hypothetical protein F1880_001449 [Penicillium rolfsii]|nr:hypothetical protein F1880_001449 [Penicillium rolfsii]
MTTRISIEDVVGEVSTSEIAKYTDYGIPVGTYVPDSELAPSRATSKAILRHRRLVFFTFDELGNPKWEPREINYLGEPMSKVCPGVIFTARNCRQNRNTDLFVEFRDLKGEAFERAAFRYLANKHKLNEDWNWPTYDIMRAEPHRRILRQVQANRLEQCDYSVPTFKRNGVDDVQGREAFMKRLEGIRDWEMENQYLITTRWNTNSLEYSQERFLLASRVVDLVQKLLHDTQIACTSDINDNPPYFTPGPGKPENLEEIPKCIISPFPTPNIPISTPVANPQSVSTPTPNRTLRRSFGMDVFASDYAHSRQQATEAAKTVQDFSRRILKHDAEFPTSEMSWVTKPNSGTQMAASPYNPQPSPEDQAVIAPWHPAHHSTENPGSPPNMFLPEAIVNPQDIENRASTSHVSSLVIPIDENQRIRIDVSREGVSPLDYMYPEPSL